MISTKAKVIRLMLELQSRGVPLVEPEAIRYYLLADNPELYLSYDCAERGVRRTLNELVTKGLLKKSKLKDKRTIYALTCKGIESAKETF